MLKKLFLVFTLLVSFQAFADGGESQDVNVDVNDTTFDIRTEVGAQYYIRTEANQQVDSWSPGDTVTLNQSGNSVTYTFLTNGNFVPTPVGGGGSGSGGGGNGNGGGVPGGGVGSGGVGGDNPIGSDPICLDFYGCAGA